MRRGFKLFAVATAVAALAITPASATEVTDSDMCEALAKASAMIETNNKGEGKTSALAALGRAAEGCEEDPPTFESVCESFGGSYSEYVYEDGLVEQVCDYWGFDDWRDLGDYYEQMEAACEGRFVIVYDGIVFCYI